MKNITIALSAFIIICLMGAGVSSAYMISSANQHDAGAVLTNFLAKAVDNNKLPNLSDPGSLLGSMGLSRDGMLDRLIAGLNKLKNTGNLEDLIPGDGDKPPVPEPGTMILLGISLITAASYLRKVYVKFN
jgi:hypothetical protein